MSAAVSGPFPDRLLEFSCRNLRDLAGEVKLAVWGSLRYGGCFGLSGTISLGTWEQVFGTR